MTPPTHAQGPVHVTHAHVRDVLAVVLDTRAQPLLLHGVNGVGAAGAVTLCLRKLQLWPDDCALQEYARFAPPSEDVREFVAAFRGEVTIPSPIPAFLWGGEPLRGRHPSVAVRLAEQALPARRLPFPAAARQRAPTAPAEPPGRGAAAMHSTIIEALALAPFDVS